MSIFSSIGNFFKSLFSTLIAKFKSFIEEALPIAKQIIIAQLQDIALKAVSELSLENLTDEEKRKAAFNTIKEYAIAHTIEAKDSLINTIIELAYQKFQS